MVDKDYNLLQMNRPAGSDDPLTKILEGHACNLGKLMGNIHSLECLLRVFLTKHDKQVEDGFDAKLGDFVGITHLTSYDALNELISKFNAIVVPQNLSLKITAHVVALRDALAHGRVFTSHPSKPMRLFKFSKPKKGDKKVEVKFSATMTPEWFAGVMKMVLADMSKVVEASNRLKFDLSLHTHG